MGYQIVKVNGFKMYLDPEMRGISSALMKGGREPGFMWMLEQEAVGELGMDIGANIGYTTLPLCRQMTKVIVIEPDKRARKLLNKNIKLNHFIKKITSFSVAISDMTGVKKIGIHRKHSNLTCIDTKINKNKYTYRKIKTTSIDDLNVLPNFIKMDIEGHEVEALRGGLKTFQKIDHCKILMEVHPQYYSSKHSLDDILHELVKIGFVFKYVESAGSACPKLFAEKGYKPFKVFTDSRYTRGIYKDINTEDAIYFCSYPHKQKIKITQKGKTISVVGNKIVRSVLLVKGQQ